MKRYHRRWTCSHTSPRRLPTMVTLHDTRFVECRWWNDGWTVKTVVTWRSSASMIPAPGLQCLLLCRDFQPDLQIFHLQWPPRWHRGKASASRAEDPGFESSLGRDFFEGQIIRSDLKVDIPVSTLPGAWRYRVITGTRRPVYWD